QNKIFEILNHAAHEQLPNPLKALAFQKVEHPWLTVIVLAQIGDGHQGEYSPGAD
ncbi:unnamed protein product, partial [Staurois parvus]